MKFDEGLTRAEDKTSPATFVCVTDCVGANEEALDCASDLAERHGAHLELLHVIDPGHTPSAPDAQMGIQFRLESLARSLRRLKKDAEARLLYGCPEEVIAKRVAEIQATLIAFLLNGSATDQSQKRLARLLTRRCACPVLAIPPGMRGEKAQNYLQSKVWSHFIKRTRGGIGRSSRDQPRTATRPRLQNLVAMMPDPA